jgi:Nucleotidyltransferase domain
MNHLQVSTPTPYPELNSVLSVLLASLQQVLADTLVGAYLQGSFAVGGFDEHSDVDFIVVVGEVLSAAQVRALQAMHERVYCLESAWEQHLGGSYFPKDVLPWAPLIDRA